MAQHSFESSYNSNKTTNSGNYGGIVKLYDIGEFLDNDAESEDIVQMRKFRTRGVFRTNEFTTVSWIVLLLSRNSLTDADLVGANSLDGWIGYHLNSEFSYKILARPRLIGLEYDSDNTQFYYLWEYSIEYTVPKNALKTFRSSEQYTDTPNLFKQLAFVIAKADLAAGGLFVEISGTMEIEYNKRTMKFSDWTGPAL